MTFDPAEEEAGLKVLGRLLYEAAGQFYLDAARRRLSLHSERRSQLPELNARVAFKACPLLYPYFPGTISPCELRVRTELPASFRG